MTGTVHGTVKHRLLGLPVSQQTSRRLGDDVVMPVNQLHALRRLCMGLPEVTERLNHDEPSWLVRNRTFVQFSERRPADRLSFWCPAPLGAREAMVAGEPKRFFMPPYVGRAWLGVFLDVPLDWDEIQEIVVDAYRLIAPEKLVARLVDHQTDVE